MNEHAVEAAGRRLRMEAVEVPSLPSVLRRRRRVRAGVAGVALVVAALGVGSIVSDGGREQTVVADGGTAFELAPDSVVLARGAVWEPAPAAATPFALGRAFATDVLGWPDADVAVGDADAGGTTMVGISDGERRVTIATSRPPNVSQWRVLEVRIHDDQNIGFITEGGDAPRVQLVAEQPPPGTVSVRWWATTAAGMVGDTTEVSTEIYVVTSPDELLSALVLYLDARGTVLGATGGTFN